MPTALDFHKPSLRRIARGLCLLPLAFVAQGAGAAPVDAGVAALAAQAGSADALIVLAEQLPVALLRPSGDYLQRRRVLVESLRATAEVSQAPLRAWLDAQGIAYRSFWITNTIQARLTPAQLAALSSRADIARISDNQVRRVLPVPQAIAMPLGVSASAAIEWGVSRVHAPQVWALGFTGQGVTIAGQDTGIRWSHAALKAHYRGWNGAVASHAYNWHDAIHDSTGNPCGNDSPLPCDDDGHGTHTVGTMLGADDGSNKVGVAPGARWIGCRNMDEGAGTPARYNECAQWLLAPTDANGNSPDPDHAPDIVSNSWGCDASEGCSMGNEVKGAIDTLVAGGILFVAAAGNAGPSCASITDQPATLDSAFAVGSMTSSNTMSSFSSRGPVAGANRTKPDLIAPGSSVRSAYNSSDTSYSTLSGTSMATPHVAGVAALMMSINPGLKGDPQRVMQILRDTSVPIGNTQVCGGIASTTFPNPVQGDGVVDAFAAVIRADTLFADGLQ